jgi:hypothetical protein
MNYPFFNQIPYYTTKKTVSETRNDIMSLLEKYNIKDYQWTRIDGLVSIKFILEGKPYSMEVLTFKAYKSKRNKKVLIVPENICYRVFYYRLKMMLELIFLTSERSDRLLMGYSLIKCQGLIVPLYDLIKNNPNLLLPNGTTALLPEGEDKNG